MKKILVAALVWLMGEALEKYLLGDESKLDAYVLPALHKAVGKIKSDSVRQVLEPAVVELYALLKVEIIKIASKQAGRLESKL
jgi:hypothetical protein